MIINITSKNSDIRYSITVERNSINKLNEYFNLKRKVLIITDNGIPKEYVEIVKKQISFPYVYTIEQGEKNKNFDNYKDILKYMLDCEFTRSDAVIALGGGVVGDLAGFIANSYMRGVDFYNIPTTLLSQVDSSIGGKCAVDFLGVKNSVGCFKFPKGVVIDPNTLKTLDERQFNAGMAEVIKMAMTFNSRLFEFIKDTDDITKNLEYVITESLKLKAYVVEKDPFEIDLRKVLNYGYTIGHAIESLSNGKLLHGECVAIGMVYMTCDTIKDELISALKKYKLPISADIDKDKVIDLIKVDKKAAGDYVTMVYVRKIGTFEFEKVRIEEVRDLL